MGSIKKTSNAKHQVDVRDKDGNRIRMRFDRKDEAIAFNSKIEEEKYISKLASAGLKKAPVRFDNIITDAISSKEALAPKSFTKYRGVFLLFGEFLATNKIEFLSKFTRDHADSFKEILTSSNAAPSTINFYLTTIKSLFNDLVQRDLIDKSPFNHVKQEREKRKTLLDRENDYYDGKEIEAFFKVSMKEQYRNAFTALFLTGLRFEELSSLKWDRIDLKKKIIQVRSDANFTTKTVTSERDIPMSNKLFSLLSKLHKKRTSEFVFTSIKNKKLSERTLLSVCKSVAISAMISKNATLHKWRHSFNSHLAQAGVDYTIRQYLLGHKPQTMTDHYTKIDPTKLHNQVSKLDKLIKNGPTKK